MKTLSAKDPNRILREDGRLIDDALRQGVRDALLRHKERRNRVVVERDGKIVWVRPEDLLDE